jgi:hypothetical protein
MPQSSIRHASQSHLGLGPRFSPRVPRCAPSFQQTCDSLDRAIYLFSHGDHLAQHGRDAARYVGDGQARRMIDDERAKYLGRIVERPRHLSRQLGERLLVAGDLCADLGEGIASELRSELGKSLTLSLWCAPGVPHRFFASC